MAFQWDYLLLARVILILTGWMWRFIETFCHSRHHWFHRSLCLVYGQFGVSIGYQSYTNSNFCNSHHRHLITLLPCQTQTSPQCPHYLLDPPLPKHPLSCPWRPQADSPHPDLCNQSYHPASITPPPPDPARTTEGRRRPSSHPRPPDRLPRGSGFSPSRLSPLGRSIRTTLTVDTWNDKVIENNKGDKYLIDTYLEEEVMKKVTEKKYLGDIISNSMKNGTDIKDKTNKAIGNFNKILSSLNERPYGSHRYKAAVLMRNTSEQCWNLD